MYLHELENGFILKFSSKSDYEYYLKTLPTFKYNLETLFNSMLGVNAKNFSLGVGVCELIHYKRLNPKIDICDDFGTHEPLFYFGVE